ncbi:hypothetical protein [Bacillus swezeyi]|uniref:Uncharacterized protein n=1 Tax=Bacillus swezeyi TaxID=1925020 RepID=A0A5M8RHM4_9BACI|nr:hypothetical protein [Bacillus swezeyi]KAA6446890.1 hypothetical protein DX927_22825 [Bacillus swezeyi]KAA6471458.1 hypothetical protein DX928_23065 [Bacillus swezeyi]
MNKSIYNEVYSYTDKKLKAHFQDNREFTHKFAVMSNFYMSRFQKFSGRDKETFEDKLFDMFKSQFFTGYFLIREFLSYEDNKFEDQFLTQPIGYLTKEVPGLIKEITGDNYETALHGKILNNVLSWAIQRYEDVRSIILDTAHEIAYLGALQAILDEKEIKSLETVQNSVEGILGTLNDALFLKPSYFAHVIELNESAENWNIYSWGDEDKLGEITVLKLIGDGRPHFSINIRLKDVFDEDELKDLIQTLSAQLMDRHTVEYEQLTIHLSEIRDFYLLS